MLKSRYFALALLLATALSPPPAFAEQPLRGVALVIGESDYSSIRKLDNPKRDARAMDDMLDALGFSVDRVLDGDAKKLRQAIADFVDEAKDADVALVYYSGHGIEAGGSDFIVPVDADLTSPESAGQSLVAVSDLLEALARTVPATIVLLDACRTNSFPAGQLVTLPGTSEAVPVEPAGLEALRGPTPVAKPDVPPDSLGMVIGFAASPGEPALDGDPGGNSPYAAALLKHFAAGGYSVGDLMTLVSEEVYLKTKAQQLPWTNSSLRRVLSFGTPVEPQDQDAAAIREGRRRLLLTIAAAPEATRKYVETIAQSENVPLDALYGMLKVLGVDTSNPSQLEAQLLDGARQLKQFMAQKPGAAKSDAELQRLAGLAETAQAEGAIDLALTYRAEASARADTLSANVDVAEADIKQDRLQIGTTYAEHARTATLNFDFATAAEMSGKAFAQVEKWDAGLALRYKWDEANALYDQGRYKGDNAALEAAIAAFEIASGLAEGGSQWGSVRNDLGNVLEALGERQSDGDLLRQAVTAYEDALKTRSRKTAPAEWARTKGNIGVALTALGRREAGPDSLYGASDAFAAALKAMKHADQPLDWARMQSNYGNVLQLLGDRVGDASLYGDAAEAHRAALEALTRERTPLDWATAENNLGIALARLGENQSAAQTLDDAIEAFRAALEERTREKVPLDWAATEDNLAGALASRGVLTLSSDDMTAAIEAFDQSVLERTRERSPLDWGMTMRNRGLAKKQLGEMLGDLDWIDRAIADYQSALTAFTREESPLEWAQTEAVLGIAALLRADKTGARSDLELARDAYAAALEVYGALGDDYASYFGGKVDDIDKRLGAK